MVISKYIRRWFGGVPRSGAPVQQDRTLDQRIREALFDDALAEPPPNAWDRLRHAIAERGMIRARGMWVLDEVTHDPPENPVSLRDAIYFQTAALRLASHVYGGYPSSYAPALLRLDLPSSLRPAFLAVVNL